MPSDRFLNLPDEKKQRIINAAITEFSRVPYDQVSINKIVRNAEIPRGSFYQYFENKLDLLSYVFTDLKKIMNVTILDTLQKTNGDIFSVVLAILDWMISMGIYGERQDLFRNVFPYLKLEEGKYLFPYLQLHMLTDTPICLNENQEILQFFLDYSNRLQQAGAVQEDILDTMEILHALLHYTVAQIFFYPQNVKTIRLHFEKKLAILKRGLCREELL